MKRYNKGQIVQTEKETNQSDNDDVILDDVSSTQLDNQNNQVELTHPDQVKRRPGLYDDYYDWIIIKSNKFGVCKLCKEKKIDKKIATPKSNTSGLRSHLKLQHPDIFQQHFATREVQDKKQQSLLNVFHHNKKNQVWNQEKFVLKSVEWVAAKYLPLSFFDDDLTQQLFRGINPHLKPPCRTAMTAAVVNTYNKARAMVMNKLKENDSKISFTVDGWTSIRTKSYYGVTGHFINDDWKMCSLAIDFIPCQGLHAGVDIAKMFVACLSEAGLEKKIQGITVDNASVNKVFIEEVEKKLNEKNIEFQAELQHFRCFPHILNLAAQNVLKELHVDVESDKDFYDLYEDDSSEDDDDNDNDKNKKLPPLLKLRGICKKLKRSQQLSKKLESYCHVHEEKENELPLDVSTRWNSSHDLITAGIKMKKSISSLTSDKDLNLQHLDITDHEWSLLQTIQKFLKSFKVLSEKLSGDQYATLPLVVVRINILLDNIEKICHGIDKKNNRTVIDKTLIRAFQAGRDKILKHYHKSNWIYCAVLILDPRHKLEIFERTSRGKELKKESYNTFQDIYRTQYADTVNENNKTIQETVESDSDEYTKSMNELYSTGRKKNRDWESELKSYLNMPRADQKNNILDWWKVNQNNFPRLAKITRDLLAICASSTPVERLFSTAGLVLRKHRNKLSDENIEYLLCLNSWFKCLLADDIMKKLEEKI